MSDASPGDRPTFAPGQAGDGKIAALIAWALYILSIPSANLLVIVGLIVAYASRATATGAARAHIEAQIALFWSVFWWTIGLWIVTIVCFASVVLFLVGFVGLFLLFVIHIWFTVKSIIGLFQLMGDRAPG